MRKSWKLFLVFIFMMSFVSSSASQRLNNIETPTEDDLPTRQTKVKSGLIRVLNKLIYGENKSSIHLGQSSLVFDDIYAYLATPNGLYRTPQPLSENSSFELIGFQNKSLYNLYVHHNALYVLKYSEELPGTHATDHSFLKSVDHGTTFIPMDGALEYCSGGYCSFLSATQAIFKDNLIFLNAGGGMNLQVSNNNGASWIPLSGTLEPMVCYDAAFELIGTRVLIGGECPLDVAYLKAGTLRPDMLGWLSAADFPANVNTPFLSNRNVQFIKHKPNSSDAYAGVEGGLLKSTDNGRSFRFVIKNSSDNTYPYITNIQFLSKNSRVIVISGHDRALHNFFLAYSKDNGENWLEITNKTQVFIGTPSKTEESDWAQFITEDSEGRILVGITHPETMTITMLHLRVDIAAFR